MSSMNRIDSLKAFIEYVTTKSIDNYNLDFIETLKKNISGCKDKKSTLIHYIIYSGLHNKELDFKILNLLSNEIPLQDSYGQTALICYFAYYKNTDLDINIIKLLSKDSIGLKNINNETALMHFYSHNDEEYKNDEKINYYILSLLKNEIGLQNNDGNTALMYYLNKNKNPSKDIIILLKNEINFINKNKDKALYFYIKYAENKNNEIIKILN